MSLWFYLHFIFRRQSRAVAAETDLLLAPTRREAPVQTRTSEKPRFSIFWPLWPVRTTRRCLRRLFVIRAGRVTGPRQKTIWREHRPQLASSAPFLRVCYSGRASGERRDLTASFGGRPCWCWGHRCSIVDNSQCTMSFQTVGCVCTCGTRYVEVCSLKAWQDRWPGNCSFWCLTGPQSEVQMKSIQVGGSAGDSDTFPDTSSLCSEEPAPGACVDRSVSLMSIY